MFLSVVCGMWHTLSSGAKLAKVSHSRNVQQSTSVQWLLATIKPFTAQFCMGCKSSITTMTASLSQADIRGTVSRDIEAFASSCEGRGLLAIDFDATIIQIHTYGRWSGGAPALAAHVRPIFRSILDSAVRMETMNVAIVTFSGQIGLIKEVLV